MSKQRCAWRAQTNVTRERERERKRDRERERERPDVSWKTLHKPLIKKLLNPILTRRKSSGGMEWLGVRNHSFSGISGILLQILASERYFSDSRKWPFRMPPIHTPTKCPPINLRKLWPATEVRILMAAKFPSHLKDLHGRSAALSAISRICIARICSRLASS